jgi:hypothetical protein
MKHEQTLTLIRKPLADLIETDTVTIVTWMNGPTTMYHNTKLSNGDFCARAGVELDVDTAEIIVAAFLLAGYTSVEETDEDAEWHDFSA